MVFQVDDYCEVVAAYHSKAIPAPEMNYCTTRKDLPAIIIAVKPFWPYLYALMMQMMSNFCKIWGIN